MSYQHLWSPERLTAAELQAVLTTAALLKHAREHGTLWGPLRGRHLALLCSSRSDATAAFQRAVTELGGTASVLDAERWCQRAGERVPEAARLLGRLYDAVDCCDLPQALIEQIEQHSRIPVFNGLARSDHPMGLLGELLTMQETAAKPLSMASLRVAGDDQSIAGHSAIVLARKAGMHVQCDADVPAAARSDGLALIDDPDFIFDTSAPALARLTQPQASRAQQAAFGARLAANRHCALQAGLVCGLQ